MDYKKQLKGVQVGEWYSFFNADSTWS